MREYPHGEAKDRSEDFDSALRCLMDDCGFERPPDPHLRPFDGKVCAKVRIVLEGAERVRSTFIEDFQSLIEETVPDTRRIFRRCHYPYDPQASYAVDCRINGIRRPLMVFALPNDDRTRDATMALLQLEKWGMVHQTLGVFEDQEEVNRKVLTRFTDVCEKQFSSLMGNRERIVRFLRDLTESGA